MAREIPRVPKDGEDRRHFDEAVKETVEIVTGRRGEKIKPLSSGSTIDQVIEKINKILSVIQP